MIHEVALLLKKDLLLEVRRKELITGLLLVVLLLSFLFIFIINSLVIDGGNKRALAMLAIWVSGLLGGLIAVEKSLQADFAGCVIDRLQVMKVSLTAFYLAKLVQNFLALTIAFILAFVFVHAGLNISFRNFYEFLLLLLPVAIGVSALLVLLSGMTYSSRLSGMLLLILALPLLIPLFAFICELSVTLALSGKINLSSVSYAFVLFLNALYLLLGINLADYVYRS